MRCRETTSFRERQVRSWGHGKLEHTGVTSKPHETSGDIPLAPDPKNSGSALWEKTPPLYYHGIGPGISPPQEHKNESASQQ